MFNNNLSEKPILKFLKSILIYLVAIYIFVILGRAIWMNWALKKEVDQIKKENIALQEKNHNLKNLITYYQSDSFKELEARDKLGLKKPDEKVILVPIKKISNNDQILSNNQADQNRADQGIPNWQAWWIYIFE